MKSNDNVLKYLTDDPSKKRKGDDNESHLLPASPWANIKRDLTNTDLKHPAVQRLLLSENDKLEHRVFKLEPFVDNFHILDKECSILRERLTNYSKFDLIYSLCITIGSGMAGLSPNFWETSGYVLLIFGVLLTLLGFAIKIFKK
jgi:hypothetical protein